MTHSVDVHVSSADESAFRAGTLGMFESSLVGIAGSAPANFIATATTAPFGAAIYDGPDAYFPTPSAILSSTVFGRSSVLLPGAPSSFRSLSNLTTPPTWLVLASAPGSIPMANYSMTSSAFVTTSSKIDRSAQLLALVEMKQNLGRVRTTRCAN